MSQPNVLPVSLPAALDGAIRAHAERTYPNECCGVLYGTEKGGVRLVSETEPVENNFESGEQFHRFSITAEALMAAERRAGKEGVLVLGFYHSHPDHPSRPSEFDREHAWPFYSYFIVSVEKGRSALLTSWQLDERTEQFESQEIRVQ